MPEKYQIIARKYRPQVFQEVIGQEAVVKTIKNSLRYKRIANAYLFSGSRGTGKTTLARLFAKALNCKNLKEDCEPCNECLSCKEISSSRSLDVIEIDGASNRGIDDIRQINDTIGYAPSGKYKIYIIDEVHMLTKEAFNALLKTLEEPPENIKFFFATTEAHKVLPTIVSRCQRFELKRITNDLIINKLESISNDLSREVEKEALYQIANFSEGSLRDAESLLDQMFCYSEGKINLEYINNALGFIDKNYFFELDKNIYDKNTKFAFEFADKIYNAGKDLSYLVEELVEHFKNLLILKLNENSLNFLSPSLKQKYSSSSLFFSQQQLFYILNTIISAITLHKNSFKKIHLETLVIKIIQSKDIVSIDTIIKRLIEIESIQVSLSSEETVKENGAFEKKDLQNAKLSEPLPKKDKEKTQNEFLDHVIAKDTDNLPLNKNTDNDSQSDVLSVNEKKNLKKNIEGSFEEKPDLSSNKDKNEINSKANPDLEKKSQLSQKDLSTYDSLIRFAQVELNAINKT